MSTAGKKNLPAPSLKDGISDYLKSVKAEWGKITWPERGQVIRETIIVLIVVLFFIAIVSSFDWIFKTILALLIHTKP